MRFAPMYRLREAYWWLVHRLCPRHRYHIINTGLPPGYHDVDDRMTAALVNELLRYFERNDLVGSIEHKLTGHCPLAQGAWRRLAALDAFFRARGGAVGAVTLDWPEEPDEDRKTRRHRVTEALVDLVRLRHSLWD